MGCLRALLLPLVEKGLERDHHLSGSAAAVVREPPLDMASAHSIGCPLMSGESTSQASLSDPK